MKTIITILFLFVLAACDKAPVNFEGGDPSKYEETEFKAPSVVQQARHPDQNADASEIITERKVIRTGYLNLSVGDVSKMKNDIKNICREYNAYISSETQSNSPDRLEYHQVIRIPTAHFDGVLVKIEALAARVDNRNIETSDVTEEFIDKEARIKTKKELENRYREILKQAKDVSDILSIEAQLNHLRSDIESMEGRLQYLKNQVAFSTLTLSFYEPVGAESALGAKTITAFANGWNMLVLFLIGLVNVWPFMLIIAAVLYIAVRRNRIRNSREATGL